VTEVAIIIAHFFLSVHTPSSSAPPKKSPVSTGTFEKTRGLWCQHLQA
jgi:hypothetical protein